MAKKSRRRAGRKVAPSPAKAGAGSTRQGKRRPAAAGTKRKVTANTRATPVTPATPAKPAAKRRARATGKSPSATGAAADPMLLARDRAVASFLFANGSLHFLLEDFPREHLTHQPSPTDTHVLWNLGHLACFYEFCTQMLGGQTHGLPAEYETLFQYRTLAKPDAGGYPSLESVMQRHVAARDRFVETARGMSARQLAEAITGDMASYAHDKLAAVERAAWHEGWHTGQVSAIRRALGLKAKF